MPRMMTTPATAMQPAISHPGPPPRRRRRVSNGGQAVARGAAQSSRLSLLRAGLLPATGRENLCRFVPSWPKHAGSGAFDACSPQSVATERSSKGGSPSPAPVFGNVTRTGCTQSSRTAKRRISWPTETSSGGRCRRVVRHLLDRVEERLQSAKNSPKAALLRKPARGLRPSPTRSARHSGLGSRRRGRSRAAGNARRR